MEFSRSAFLEGDLYMARGVARSIEDRIGDIDAKIKKKQDELKALQEKRNELFALKKNDQAAQVIQAADEKGLSLDDIIDMIKSR